MSEEIKSLTPKKELAPPWWSMFEDSTGGFSYTRIVGLLVVIIFFSVWAYLSFTTGVMVVPPKEMVYILLIFAAAKPVQRFAEARELQSQLDFEFQSAQIEAKKNENPV